MVWVFREVRVYRGLGCMAQDFGAVFWSFESCLSGCSGDVLQPAFFEPGFSGLSAVRFRVVRGVGFRV